MISNKARCIILVSIISISQSHIRKIRGTKVCYLSVVWSIVLNKRKTLISRGRQDEIRSGLCKPESVFITSKWGLCFIPNAGSPWPYVWWHVRRMGLKCRHDFKIPLEALFSCLGLADVYQICSNYDLWNEPWWKKVGSELLSSYFCIYESSTIWKKVQTLSPAFSNHPDYS